MKQHNPRGSGSLKRPSSNTKIVPGTVKCPWKWSVNLDSSRKPRSIVIAECENCDLSLCRKVTYFHTVLVLRNDCKTGEKVWHWKVREFPIAYVYDV